MASFRVRLISATLMALSVSPAVAQGQDYRQRHNQLTQLSEVFGELHWIRRICTPETEGDLWRERMKNLINLEDPAASQRDIMVRAFNRGYESAKSRIDYCDRYAQDRASARAQTGQELARALAEPLHAERLSRDGLEFTP